MAFTSYNLDNDRSFRKRLTQVGKEFSDLRIPLTLIALDFYKSEQSIFKNKGPGQYPDLSPRYKKQKQRMRKFVYPILFSSGRLARSLLGKGAEQNITVIGPKELTVGTSVPYAVYHQSDNPRKKIPLRKFLFIGPESSNASSEQVGRLKRWTQILDDFSRQKANALHD